MLVNVQPFARSNRFFGVLDWFSSMGTSFALADDFTLLFSATLVFHWNVVAFFIIGNIYDKYHVYVDLMIYMMLYIVNYFGFCI